MTISGRRLISQITPTYIGVKLGRTLTYREHMTALRGKVTTRTALIRRHFLFCNSAFKQGHLDTWRYKNALIIIIIIIIIIAGTSWGASTPTLRTSTLALVYAPAEYYAPVWCRSAHTRLVDASLNAALRTITGCLRPTDQLPILADNAPPALRREAATLVLGHRACQHDHLLHVKHSTQRKRLKSRRPPTHHVQQLVSSVPPQDTVKHWAQARWAETWAATPRGFTNSCPPPSSNSGHSVGLCVILVDLEPTGYAWAWQRATVQTNVVPTPGLYLYNIICDLASFLIFLDTLVFRSC